MYIYRYIYIYYTFFSLQVNKQQERKEKRKHKNNKTTNISSENSQYLGCNLRGPGNLFVQVSICARVFYHPFGLVYFIH